MKSGEDRVFHTLSDRERQVIGLAAAGLVDKQIGQELEVSLNTLKTYWNRIREKAGSHSRSALVAAYVAEELSESSPELLDPLAHEGWVMDAESRTILATDAINDDHGLERGIAHPALKYAETIHPEDADGVRDAVFSVADGERDSMHLLFRVVTSRGVELVNSSVYGVRDGQGNVRKVYGFRVRSLDCRPGSDPTVRIGHWERRYPERTITIDATMAEIIGQPGTRKMGLDEVAEMLSEGEADRLVGQIDQAVADGESRVEGDLRFKLPDGEEVWSRVTRRIVREGERVTIYGTLVVFH